MKRADFETFAKIVDGIANGKHREIEGFASLLKLAFSMNSNGAYRKLKMDDIIAQLKPSETVRQTTRTELKIQSELHGDMQRVAEMTTPDSRTF